MPDDVASTLDATVQARIPDLPGELQQGSGLTYVFVSHDLAMTRPIADTVPVMRDGRAVAAGSVEQAFHAPTMRVS